MSDHFNPPRVQQDAPSENPGIRAGQAFLQAAENDPKAQQAIKRLKALSIGLQQEAEYAHSCQMGELERSADRLRERIFEKEKVDSKAYFSARDAMTLTGLTLPEISKLCKKDGPIRFRRKRNRLSVNILDLADYLIEKNQKEFPE